MNVGYDDTVLHHRADFVLAATLADAGKSTTSASHQQETEWGGAGTPWLECTQRRFISEDRGCGPGG